ncbi:MAG: hypothetical protein HYW23_02680 [Candidatus Aenigmarchaeota archaeon]|nr:hypothetical protein [Candidatus Aenigmarchaeota archaeon]
MKTAYVFDLGLTDYYEALKLQERLSYLRQVDAIGDTLVLLEHPSSITFGKNAHTLDRKRRMAKVSLEELGKKAPIYDVGRGGYITYHEPGQLVSYPILNLRDSTDRAHILSLAERVTLAARYVSALEETMIQTASTYGIDLVRNNTIDIMLKRIRSFTITGTPDVNGLLTDVKGLPASGVLRHPGVWYKDASGMRKVGSLGVETKSYDGMLITMHGLAFNVNNSLELSELIYPCGLDIEETSLAKITGKSLPMSDVRKTMKEKFASIFGYKLKEIKLEELPLEEHMPIKTVESSRLIVQ